jgi:hypothetical protein
MKRGIHDRLNRSRLKVVIAAVVAALAAFPLGAAARQPGGKMLCNEGGVLCVPGSLQNSLVNNPLKLDLQVNSPKDVDVDWELREGSGSVLAVGSTEGLKDYPGEDTGYAFHVTDFILKPASSERGTLILTPIRHKANDDDDGQELPQLTIPVRLSTRRSIVTIAEPEDPNRFHDEFYNWANMHVSTDPTPYRTGIPFTPNRIEVMYFDRSVAVGITAAAVINRYQGESPWYLTHWSRVGKTAHVAMDGSGWSGVSNYVSLLNYVIRRSMLSIPGVEDYVYDRTN